MKIKHYIVTYNNESRINACLESLFDSGSDLSNLSIYIINNHSKIKIKSEFIAKVNVINNQTRPDFSTGHLARNWNQAIINGFKDLNNPDCDIVITSQDDTIFEKNYIDKSIDLCKKFDFFACGTGDQFIIYSPLAIKRIGLWDERFCNIGYQEADYFLRAVRYHVEKVSINDFNHGRLYNTQNKNIFPIKETISGSLSNDEAHVLSKKYHMYSEYIFRNKWKINPQPWLDIDIIKSIEPNITSFIYYPYFEKDIDTLKEQKYMIN